jgi:hypothetical protein
MHSLAMYFAQEYVIQSMLKKWIAYLRNLQEVDGMFHSLFYLFCKPFFD